jgi:hypothetical protein
VTAPGAAGLQAPAVRNKQLMSVAARSLILLCYVYKRFRQEQALA